MSCLPCVSYAPPYSGIPRPERRHGRSRKALGRRRQRRAWLREQHRALGGLCQQPGCRRPTRLHDGLGPLQPDHATVDHHIPWSKGGLDHPDNWRLLCFECNSRKGDTMPTWRPKQNPIPANTEDQTI